MLKWDYHTLICSYKKLDEALESSGDEGWELCGNSYLNGTYSLIFKRPQVEE